jgi:hypothetical protein
MKNVKLNYNFEIFLYNFGSIFLLFFSNYSFWKHFFNVIKDLGILIKFLEKAGFWTGLASNPHKKYQQRILDCGCVFLVIE